MGEKYFNNNIIGNSKILVSIDNKGNILRYYAPNIDYMQHIEEHKIGLIISNNFVWLDNEKVFDINQYYEENTNILYTEYSNEKLVIQQRDYVDINNDLLVRKYTILKNEENIQDLELLVYSDMKRNEDRFVSGWYNEELDCLLQYAKDSYFSTFSKNKVVHYRVNDAFDSAERLDLYEEGYVGLNKESFVTYNFTNTQEGKQELCIYLCFRDSLFLTDNIIKTIRNIDERYMYEDTKKYWNGIIKKANMLNFKDEKQKEIYIRSIILLLSYINDDTGGIIAACEPDEKLEKCGRYAYCWPRDATMKIRALNMAGFSSVADIFFTKFGKATQFTNGMWEQRYYTDCNFAPGWGAQIDETSSMLIGMIEQYQINKNEVFLNMLRENIELGMEYLLKNMDEITCDLWETYYARHTYSYAAIYCAFNTYLEKMPQPQNEKLIRIKMQKILEIIDGMWLADKQCYRKSDNNELIDSSVAGLVWPYAVINPIDDKMVKSIETVEKVLTVPVGGICRFEKDKYIDTNPWIVCTLWISMYYIKKYRVTNDKADYDKAEEYLDWATEHASKFGYLAEQISREDGSPAWVNGLGWSHAMYMLCLEELYGKK